MQRRAVIGSLLVHLLVLLAILLWPRALPPTEEEKPTAPVMQVELIDDQGSAGAAGGLAGGSSGGGQTEASRTEASTAETRTQVAETQAAVQEQAPTPVVEEAPTPPTPTPAPDPVEAQSNIVAPPAIAEAPLIVPPLEPQPQPRTLPRPPPPKPKPPTPVAQKPDEPTPQPQPEPQPRPAQQIAADPAPAPTPAPFAVAAAPQAGTAPSGTTAGTVGGPAGIGHGVEGRGRGIFGTGQGPGDDYLDRLRRHLQRYKKYPPEARDRKQEGEVLVAFVLARDGTVIEAQIERTSGFPMIDQAVLDMMRRGSPVPPVPHHYTAATLSISMPVRFTLGFFERLR